MIVIEMLLQGVHFDAGNVRKLPLNKNFVSRTFSDLIDAGMIKKSTRRGKYLLTPGFLRTMKREVTRRMPRGIFIHYPDFGVFDVSGIESWTQEELDLYVKELRRRWSIRTRSRPRG